MLNKAWRTWLFAMHPLELISSARIQAFSTKQGQNSPVNLVLLFWDPSAASDCAISTELLDLDTSSKGKCLETASGTPSQAAPAARGTRDSKGGRCSTAQAGWCKLKKPADEQPCCGCKLKSNFSQWWGCLSKTNLLECTSPWVRSFRK